MQPGGAFVYGKPWFLKQRYLLGFGGVFAGNFVIEEFDLVRLPLFDGRHEIRAVLPKHQVGAHHARAHAAANVCASGEGPPK